MKKILLLLAFALPLLSCKKDPFAGKQCVTLEATNVGQSGATLNGFFNPFEDAPNIFCYFLVSEDENTLTVEDVKAGKCYVFGSEEAVPDANHRVSMPLTEVLKPATTYYFRALIYKVSETEEEGFVLADNIKSFTTKSLRTGVVSLDVTESTPFSATLPGRLDSDAGEDVYLQAWFLWGLEGSTLETLQQSGTKVDARFAEGAQGGNSAFSAGIAELWPSTTYSYVACARFGEEILYGDVKSFTTPELNLSVTTLDASAGPVKATLTAAISPNIKGFYGPDLFFLVGPRGSSLESLKADGIKAKAAVDFGGDYQSFSAVTPILDMATDYSYVAGAKLAGKEAYGEIKDFSTTTRTAPEGAVEMGLSVFWAPKNVGAETEADDGDFYAWGEVEPKETYSADNYKWYKDGVYTKYNVDVDRLTRLEPEDDAATANWGAPWRMATAAEWQELADECDWTEEQRNGKPGYLVTSRRTGNSIYLLRISTSGSAGNYYRGTLVYSSCEKGQYRAMSSICIIHYDSSVSKPELTNVYFRFQGTQIRPVRE